MTDNLHVVYRVHDQGLITEDWATYSFPHGIYMAGSSLDEARSELHEAAVDLLGEDVYNRTNIVEHIERPMYDGVYLRIAVDQRSLDREDAARAMRGSLSSGSTEAIANRVDLDKRLPAAASGDLIIVACVPTDTIRWILDQMAEQDVLGVCLAGPAVGRGRLVSWSYLIREGADLDATQWSNAESLSDADLTIDATISDLIRANNSENARGRLVGASRS